MHVISGLEPHDVDVAEHESLVLQGVAGGKVTVRAGGGLVVQGIARDVDVRPGASAVVQGTVHHLHVAGRVSIHGIVDDLDEAPGAAVAIAPGAIVNGQQR